jgi:hypothetical protein
MNLVEIFEQQELKECITKAFSSDKKLIEKYHIKGESLNDCVIDTFSKILGESQNTTLDWYGVYDDEEGQIGFVVISKAYDVLYSFGLNINYREDYSSLFFDEISNLFDGCFRCGLWNKNTRAIEFLERHGMDKISVDSEKTILEICH